MAPFNNDKYKHLQIRSILNKIQEFDHLYIEIGGKFIDDNHAARVLPGFDPNVKLSIFKELINDISIILCISAKDIINSRMRSDYNITYAEDILNTVDILRNNKFNIDGIFINLYENNESIQLFEHQCFLKNINIYKTYKIDDYPNNVDLILSDAGFGKNDYIKTSNKITLILAPGAGSGKLNICLNQLYHDHLNGISSGYVKYETFPVWNLPLDHPVNKAYEAATLNIKDYNVIDPYYKNKTGKCAVNYNRDVDAFPILSQIFQKIYGYDLYTSPTDMGINNIGFAIENDDEVRKAAQEEITKRLNLTV